tara:strand:+ start:69 stop:236 length:168 start_codon:yes stop_codon:yes gene_type:complete
MAKIYPESISKKGDDIMYDLMRSVVCGFLFCVCMCVGLIVLITLAIENEIKDGSY